LLLRKTPLFFRKHADNFAGQLQQAVGVFHDYDLSADIKPAFFAFALHIRNVELWNESLVAGKRQQAPELAFFDAFIPVFQALVFFFLSVMTLGPRRRA